MDVNERFERVLSARKTTAGLLDLFEKLRVSEKFSEEEKPVCFGLLLEEAAQRVKPAEMQKLLSVSLASGAVRRVRTLPSEDADRVLAKLVQRVLTIAPLSQNAVQQALDNLLSFGVCQDRGHALSLACCAGMPIETLDKICDFTH